MTSHTRDNAKNVNVRTLFNIYFSFKFNYLGQSNLSL
jgi:hypothetical protein